MTVQETIALDGSQFQFDHHGFELTSSWSFFAYVTAVRGQRFRLNAGPRGLNEQALDTWESDQLVSVETASMNGNDLLAIGYNPTEPQTLFVWQGEHHEIYTTVAGFGAPFEVLADLLSHVDPVDSPSGVTARPRSGTGATLDGVTGSNMLPGIAGLTVWPTEDVVTGLPKGRGVDVPGGELWRQEETNGSTTIRSLLLANNTVVTQITPLDQREAEALDLAENLVAARVA